MFLIQMGGMTMEPISRLISNSTIYAWNKVTERGEQSRQEIQNIQNINPNQDTYIPEEPQESIGRYWLGKDENGNPKIYSDESKQAQEIAHTEDVAKELKQVQDTSDTKDKQNQSIEDEQEKSQGTQVTKCTVNTDKVDREIQKLKEKQAELEQKLQMETEENKKQKLEQQLSQVEQELRRKDNDAYKRQHAEYTFS